MVCLLKITNNNNNVLVLLIEKRRQTPPPPGLIEYVRNIVFFKFWKSY